jgi:hypothetical protein
MKDVRWQIGCQFGKHGEPFLWHGSGDDDVDIAIMQLINLASDNPKLAHEACEFIDACKKDAVGKQPTPAPEQDQSPPANVISERAFD